MLTRPACINTRVQLLPVPLLFCVLATKVDTSHTSATLMNLASLCAFADNYYAAEQGAVRYVAGQLQQVLCTRYKLPL